MLLTHRRTGVLGSAVAAVLLAGAPVAAAKTTAHHAPSLASVTSHVRAADHDLKLVMAGNTRYATALAREGRAGLLEAVAMKQSARTATGRIHAAQALQVLNGQFTRDTKQMTHAIRGHSTAVRTSLAPTLDATMFGQDSTGGLLSQLLPLLPAGVQGQIGPILANLPVLSGTEASSLAGLLGASSIPCVASGAVQQALTLATVEVNGGIAQAQTGLAAAPSFVQGELSSALGLLPGILDQVKSLIGGILPCSGDTTAPTTPGTTTPTSGTTTTPTGITPVDPTGLASGITTLLNSILSDVLPVATSGATAVPAQIPGILQELLGSLSGLFGGSGGFSWSGGFGGAWF